MEALVRIWSCKVTEITYKRSLFCLYSFLVNVTFKGEEGFRNLWHYWTRKGEGVKVADCWWTSFLKGRLQGWFYSLIPFYSHCLVSPNGGKIWSQNFKTRSISCNLPFLWHEWYFTRTKCDNIEISNFVTLAWLVLTTEFDSILYELRNNMKTKVICWDSKLITC